MPSHHWYGMIYLVAAARAALGQFFDPAKSALMPRLVSRDQLMAANALNQVSYPLTGLLGAFVGGALLTWLGLSAVVLVDSATFLVSAAMIVLMRAPAAAPGSEQGQPARRSGVDPGAERFWAAWLSGLPLVRSDGAPTGVAAMAVGSQIGSRTILQTRVADAYRGRVFGAFSTVLALLQLVGTALASGLGDRVGTLPVLDGAGGLLLLAGIAAFVTLRRQPMEVMPSTTIQARASGA